VRRGHRERLDEVEPRPRTAAQRWAWGSARA
jgi:hypothetical protein